MRVGPVRTQMTNKQQMNSSDMSAQNIPNFHVYSLGKSKSKRINMRNSELHA